MKLTKSQQETVKQCFLFRDLSPAVVKEILGTLEVQSFRGGETIYTPQAFQRALGIVAEGEVSVMKPGGAQLNVIPKGGLFGAAALFDESDTEFSYVTTLIAHKACQVIFLSDVQLEAWMRAYPAMAMAYIRFLSGRIRFLNRRIDAFTSPSSEEALMKYLQEAAEAAKLEDGAAPEVTVSSFARLARSLSMSRATLYRALGKLEEDGLIQKNKNRIYLLGETLSKDTSKGDSGLDGF